MGFPPSITNWPQVANFVPTTHQDTYPAISPSLADLSGMSVLVVGASQGIGRTTATRFAAAGCSRIAIAARSASGLAEVKAEILSTAAAFRRPAPEVFILEVDVTSEPSVRAAAAAYEQAFGIDAGLDVLINNAGYMEQPWRRIAKSDNEDDDSDATEWRRSWEVNFLGMYLSCRYFIPLVRRSSALVRTVINISSAGGHNINSGASAYQTAKFAATRLSEFAQVENDDAGLVSVALHPGSVRTELALRMPEFMHEILTDTPEMAADVMVWLARKRKDWLAGRFVSACWDVDELEARKDEIIAKDLLKFRMVV